MHDVRCIEPASEPYLDDLKVGVDFAEVLEGQGRQELEVHERAVPAVLAHPLDFRPHPFHESGEVLLPNGLHPHADPLGYRVK